MAKKTTEDQTQQQAQTDIPDMSAMMQNCCGGSNKDGNDMSTKMQDMCRNMAGSKAESAKTQQSGCGC